MLGDWCWVRYRKESQMRSVRMRLGLEKGKGQGMFACPCVLLHSRKDLR